MQEFATNDPLRMAGATAFFTTFALPAILLIIIQIFGLVFDPEKLSMELFARLSGILGTESSMQLVNTLKAFGELAKNWWITLFGFIFLLFVATTLFKVIKNSINQLWKVRVMHKQSFGKLIKSRLTGLLMIFFAGILFMIGILAEGIQVLLGKYIRQFFPEVSNYYNSTLNYIISVFIVMAWFALVFRFLADARPTWRVCYTGGILTSVLFNIGKLILGVMLSYSNINTIFGASASIVLILLFVFYSALIFYYGACFTKLWSTNNNYPIRPLHHAVHYRLTESIEKDED